MAGAGIGRPRSGPWVRRGSSIYVLGLGGGGGPDAQGDLEGFFEGELEALDDEELEIGRPTLRRGSRGTAVRDLQGLLKTAGFDPGPIDGIFGSRTAAAVISFQRARRLTVDGIVGGQTWGALGGASPGGIPTPVGPPPAPGGATGPYPMVNALMPKEGPGFYCRMAESRRWGLPETIEALQQVGRYWFMARPSGPRMVISDISKRGGGKLCFSSGFCHASHQVGLDVDIRPVRNDGKESAVSYTSSSYSLELTSQLIDLIRNNGLLGVKTIAFLDPRIPNLSRWSGHADHLHVRFCMPPSYRSSINLRKTYSTTPPNYRC